MKYQKSTVLHYSALFCTIPHCSALFRTPLHYSALVLHQSALLCIGVHFVSHCPALLCALLRESQVFRAVQLSAASCAG
eukprot:15311341-Alexandrium_andersonii.AAC.1